MVFIKREDDGEITGVSTVPEPGFREELDSKSGELAGFLASSKNNAELAQSDLDLIRVLDDLIEVLIGKGVFSFTDLPQEAQSKLLERSKLRAKWRNSLELLDEESYL